MGTAVKFSKDDRADALTFLRGEAAFERMREYVDHRLATDLGYRKDRHHSDGGYALNYETL
jgi:hypothetical protein